MTDAEKAYELAESRIAATVKDGYSLLILSGLNDEILKSLSAIPPGIADLTEVTWLDLRNTQITDLAPIASMTGIKQLDLGGTEITELTPIASLTGITRLDLSGTPITDIAPMAGMTGITWVNLSDTQITDLTPIASLTGITRLYLDNTAIVDLAPIAGMDSLIDLFLIDAEAVDLRPTLSMTGLGSDGAGPAVTFRNSAATRADARLKEISEINDWEDRLKQLRDYLVDWVPPGEETTEEPFVFLSYAREDADRIDQLRTFLYSQNIPTWMDSDIPAGAKWRDRVQARLEQSAVVATFWTQASTQSDAVREEASRAQDAGRFIQVMMDGTPPPFGFAETQHADLRDWDGTDTHAGMRRLLAAIRDQLVPPSAADMQARLLNASPIAMAPQSGLLVPLDTPVQTPPAVVNPDDLAARLDGLRQSLLPLQDMASDIDNYQFPPDLRHALAGCHNALHAAQVNWYALDDAQLSLTDCMSHHHAEEAWNTFAVSKLNRFVVRIVELRPLLQPKQVQLDQPNAKPSEPEPHIRDADQPDVATLADQIEEISTSADADQVLSAEARAYIQNQVDQIRNAANIHEPGPKFRKLRRGARGMAYAAASIIAAVGTGVTVNLLTAPAAAATLAQKLTPILDRLIQFFL